MYVLTQGDRLQVLQGEEVQGTMYMRSKKRMIK